MEQLSLSKYKIYLIGLAPDVWEKKDSIRLKKCFDVIDTTSIFFGAAKKSNLKRSKKEEVRNSSKNWSTLRPSYLESFI